jgi:hypothetical protein
MLGAFKAAGVDMSDDVWSSAFADHLARCGGDASVHTVHSWLVTAPAAGGPGGGRARMPVGTYLYLHAVCVGNPIAVPCMER